MQFFFRPLCFLCCLICSLSCEKKERSSKPQVLVSIPPYVYFVHRIGGDSIDISCLTPKGTNPHLYETPPRLIEKTLQASLWFRLGDPMEQKFLRLFNEKAPQMKILSMSQGLPLLSESSACCHDENAVDLHIWLSPKLAAIQAQTIFEELSLLLPQHRDLYRSRLQSLLSDLEALDKELTALFSHKYHETILLAHPSLGYFCRDYQIEQLSIETEGKEPRPHALLTLLKEAKEKQVRKIFLQPQFESRGAEKIAKELEIPLESIDAYEEDYFNCMRKIAHAIAF